MSLLVIESGLQSSVQGRKVLGQRHLGMPFAGPADPLCHAIANWLVENPSASSAIELTLTRSVFECTQDCTVGVTGAAAGISIDGRPAPLYTSHHLRKGQSIVINAARHGCRSYLAIAGGVRSGDLFNSGSTFLPAGLGGHEGRALQAGDCLQTAGPAARGAGRTWPAAMMPHFGDTTLLRAVSGAEQARVDIASRTMFWNSEFTVSRRASRTGMALEGRRIETTMAGIASAATFPGTVQCPPSGIPFLLGIDAQTSGGYSRLAEVIRADRHLIGQLRPGQRVRFIRTDIETAQKIYRAKRVLWRGMIADCAIE